MLRNAAAKVRSAARACASEMRECSATVERPSGGSARERPTSSVPGGHPAAGEGFEPLDVRLVERADGICAHAAGCREHRKAQLLAGLVTEIRRREPAEFVLQELFAAAPVALPPHDHGIELSTVELVEQRMREVDPHVEHEGGVERIHACDHVGEVGPRDMIADADRQPSFGSLRTGERAVVRGQEIACPFEKCGAFRRQPHRTRRAFDEPLGQAVFQPLELQADG
jgi:hypothetical protein